jgi:hypothetical protein
VPRALADGTIMPELRRLSARRSALGRL